MMYIATVSSSSSGNKYRVQHLQRATSLAFFSHRNCHPCCLLFSLIIILQCASILTINAFQFIIQPQQQQSHHLHHHPSHPRCCFPLGRPILQKSPPSFVNKHGHQEYLQHEFRLRMIQHNNDYSNHHCDSNVKCIPFDKISETLHQQINNNEDDIIAIEGYITHRRVFGSSLAFVDLVSSTCSFDRSNNSDSANDDNDHVIVQALLKKQEYIGNMITKDTNTDTTTNAAKLSTKHDNTQQSSSFSSILKSLYPGSKVYLQG
mmetsp:Transcript_20853/g.23647  ORF Transcript_20853/g.23647 Transcript_20853/m.23647 type:complete len:262 (+) Transcript_20853:249-1034(+)